MAVKTKQEGGYPPAKYFAELRAVGVARFKCGDIEVEFDHRASSPAIEGFEKQVAIGRSMRAGPILVDGEPIDELSPEEQARLAEAEQKEHDDILFHSAD